MTAFDTLAPTYDDDFTQTVIGRHLRARVYWRLRHLFKPDDHVLELGCGTGEDALWLARRGIHITATDVSPAMLAITRQKLAHQPYARVKPLNINDLPDDAFDRAYDGVLSNFGGVNCARDLSKLAEWLADRVKRRRVVAFALMSPHCLWEFLWHGAHFDFDTATRRWRGTTFQADETQAPLPIIYPTIDQLKHAFAPYFMVKYVMPLGVLLPPSDVYKGIEKRPRVLKTLIALDKQVQRFSFLAEYADHYWIELIRC